MHHQKICDQVKFSRNGTKGRFLCGGQTTDNWWMITSGFRVYKLPPSTLTNGHRWFIDAAPVKLAHIWPKLNSYSDFRKIAASKMVTCFFSTDIDGYEYVVFTDRTNTTVV